MGDVETAVLQAYDVLQVERDGTWLDFSTLRTEEDFSNARRIMRNGWLDWNNVRIPAERFRVWRSMGDEVIVQGGPICELCSGTAQGGYSDRAPRCSACWTKEALDS